MPDAVDYPLLLARMQFAANITFHILFPSISIALGWLLMFFRWRWRRSGDGARLHPCVEAGRVEVGHVGGEDGVLRGRVGRARVDRAGLLFRAGVGRGARAG